MAEGAGAERELVFCHSCENEWYRTAGGLKCPQCQSDAVEIIQPDSDPHVLPGMAHETHHAHAPGPVPDAPDPEEADVTTYEWSGPGVQFSSTTYRSPPSGSSRPGAEAPPVPLNPMAQIFQSVFTAASGRGDDRSGHPSGASTSRHPPSPAPGRPSLYSRTPYSLEPFPPEQHRPPPWSQPHATTTVFAPQGGFIFGASSAAPPDLAGLRAMFNATHTGPTAPARPPDLDDLRGIFISLLGPMPPLNDMFPTPPEAHPSVLRMFSNPADARRGDAVYTQEALDSVISQLMETHGGDGAPGPASNAAIAALPRIPMAASMLDDRGNAECSICMDDVPLGATVVRLPCSHWFHDACVAAWLREHDTCPQCRCGIMPKEGEGDGARQTGQPPRNMSWLWGGGGGGGDGGESGGSGDNASSSSTAQRSHSSRAAAASSTGWPGLVENVRREMRGAVEGAVQHATAVAAAAAAHATTASGPALPPRPRDGDTNLPPRSTAHGEHAPAPPPPSATTTTTGERDRERRSQDGTSADGAGSAGGRAGLTGWLGRRFGG